MSFMISDQASLLSSDLRQRLERRLLFALSRYDSRILRTEVVLKHAKPQAAEGVFECDVIVELLRASRVSVSAKSADLGTCIDRAAERSSRAVGRSIGNANDGDGGRASSPLSSAFT